jgi:hypothetical protein
MKKERKIRVKKLNVRLNEDEKEKLISFYKRTIANGLSEYAREVLLRQPVIIFYRNQIADDFLEELIRLRNDLNALGNNFNQAVHRLHTLDHIPEIKAWAILNETGKRLFLKKVNEITEKMSQIYSLWLQK